MDLVLTTSGDKEEGVGKNGELTDLATAAAVKP